jgi:hypothetical protein
LLELPNEQSETISDALLQVAHDLPGKGFIIPAVVTDNATNEKAAVRALARKSEIPLFRVACLSHTVNLAVHDVLDLLAGGGKDRFFTEMNTLRDALPTAVRDGPTPFAFVKVLKLVGFRWGSIWLTSYATVRICDLSFPRSRRRLSSINMIFPNSATVSPLSTRFSLGRRIAVG